MSHSVQWADMNCPMLRVITGLAECLTEPQLIQDHTHNCQCNLHLRTIHNTCWSRHGKDSLTSSSCTLANYQQQQPNSQHHTQPLQLIPAAGPGILKTIQASITTPHKQVLPAAAAVTVTPLKMADSKPAHCVRERRLLGCIRNAHYLQPTCVTRSKHIAASNDALV